LCLLACPVWRQTHDIRLTPHGRAKALQHGASLAEIGAAISSCTLCGACEPVCPEQIPLVDLVVEMRRQLPIEGEIAFRETNDERRTTSGPLLLPGKALRTDGARLTRIAALLDIAIAEDDGSDIATAIESGMTVPSHRFAAFLESLKRAERLIVAEGLLLRQLKNWLPGKPIKSLGEALSGVEAVRSKLRASDLYVIEPRAFHHDHARLVGHYDALRKAYNLNTNLDLQRLAVPTAASSVARSVDAADQARWILEGRAFERVVVEDANDCEVFAAVTDRPVLHLGDL
jgi:ferredoxin